VNVTGRHVNMSFWERPAVRSEISESAK